MRKIAEFIYKIRFILLVVLIGLTIFSSRYCGGTLDNGIEVWFSETNPAYIDFIDFRDSFEGNRYLWIVLRAKDIFSLDILEYVKEKTLELEDVTGVRKVYSLQNSNKVISTPDGVEINPLLNDLSVNNLSKIRKYALEDELFQGYLVSEDAAYTSIIVTFENLDVNKVDKVREQIRRIVFRDNPPQMKIYFLGEIESIFQFNEFSKQNQTIFPLLIITATCLLIFFVYRDWRRVGIVLFTIMVSVFVTLSLYALLGFTLNLITGMIIPLIAILSISAAIHIMGYFDEMDACIRDKREVFIRTVSFIITPCFISSATTALGLFSLIVSTVEPVKHFGLVSCIGIIFSFCAAIIIVPTLLLVSPQHINKSKGLELNKLLKVIQIINQKKYKVVLWVAAIGTIFMLFGITKIVIETNELEWFKKDSDFYKTVVLIDNDLCGVTDLEVIIKGKPDDLNNPIILERIDKLSAEIRKMPYVKKVISLATYVKRVNKALNNDDPQYYRVPEQRELIAQELFLFSFSDAGRNELERYVSSDYSRGRISIKIKKISSAEIVQLSYDVKRLAEESFKDNDIQFSLSGFSYMYAELEENLQDSQIKSFSMAFLLIIGLMFIIFNSLKYGLISILPNLFPIVFILGMMGWLNIKLNVATVMIASISLGIAVDDTIHLLFRFRNVFSKTNSVIQAINNSIFRVGQAVIFTSVINILGFTVMLSSNFMPTREFGILIAFTLFFALLGDLFILPSLLIIAKRFFEKRNY
ncbi:MAG: MMPL family transporter [Candidatus Omnitrophota bacterium]